MQLFYIDLINFYYSIVMLELSEKQEALRDYLLTKLGFQTGEYLEKYILALTNIAHVYRNIRAIPVEKWDIHNPIDFYYRDGDFYVPERYTVIDYLIDEYKLKKEQLYKYKSDSNKIYISATDLANYTYCPVGYSIANTFETDKPTTAETGTKLHEEHRLLNKFAQIVNVNTNEEKEQKVGDFVTDGNRCFFEEILNSEISFSGHGNDLKNKYFINESLNYIGQPDYIFKNNTGKYFIVEEKFKKEKDLESQSFYHNHKVQLLSYMYYIQEYDIHHGYLVYWLYNYAYGYTNCIRKCEVIKIHKEEAVKNFLNQAMIDVKLFIEKKYFNIIPSNLNPNKCGNCVFNRYCGHKTKRLNQVTLQYQLSYNKLYYAKYPETLNKDNNTNDETK